MNVRAHHNRKEVGVKDAVVAVAQVTNSPEFPEVRMSLAGVPECHLEEPHLASERNSTTSPVEGPLEEQDFVYLEMAPQVDADTDKSSLAGVSSLLIPVKSEEDLCGNASFPVKAGVGSS